MWLAGGIQLYKSIITKSEFSEGDLLKLFEWKNSMPLSGKKEQAFRRLVLQQEELINVLKKDFDQERFEKYFGKMSAIWQIFLLHIIRPLYSPIFDRYVYRAFIFIQNQEEKTLPFSQSAKRRIFYQEYSPFFVEMLELADNFDNFQLDKALWTFGKMLKEYPGLIEKKI